ncbi:hypothetical protein PR003_g14524 [Phytophthora rubi]|uniref:Secreted protein n=1 Tax=Phytophthora rubi TaxID=129364 RepID=A0A6A3L2H8_9STRA|nr:hypothetical protein PR002_g14397 [Phytophthora rubi]KAE9332429.1 hypothetical protein PR003_g14524 [Phytophthora rubi]
MIVPLFLARVILQSSICCPSVVERVRGFVMAERNGEAIARARILRECRNPLELDVTRYNQSSKSKFSCEKRSNGKGGGSRLQRSISR